MILQLKFFNTAGQLFLTRQGKTGMDGGGIVFELYTAPLKILGEELQRVHHFKYLGSSVAETVLRHDNRNVTESKCSMEKLAEMQWGVV